MPEQAHSPSQRRNVSAGNIIVGNTSTNTGQMSQLVIENGGVVTTMAGVVISGSSLGQGPAAPALVLVNGGTLSGPTVSVGQNGVGTLTVQNGGVVNAPGGVFVSTIGFNFGTPLQVSATGTVNIGAPPGPESPVAPGFLQTPTVALQNGGGPGLIGNPGTLNFKHILTAYEFTPMITNAAPGFPTIGVVNVLAGTTIFTPDPSVGSQSVNIGSLNIGGPYTAFPAILTVNSGSSVNVVSEGAAGSAAIGTNVGPGTLNINTGGSVTANSLFIGALGAVTAPGSSGTGTVNVTGPNASLTSGASGFAVVGASDGVGTLNITNGGTVNLGTSLVIGNAAQTVPGGAVDGPQGTGTVLVSGLGSTLTVAPNLTVGQYGHGTLTVQNGGVVNAPGGVFVSTIGLNNGTPQQVSAMGTVNIGAPPGQSPEEPGILNTPEVHLQNGGGPGLMGSPGTLNFNHTSPAYVFSPTITGTGPGFPNIGVVNQLAGTTILTAHNDYGGGTNIRGGTLAAGVPDSDASTVAAGSFALGVGDVSVLGGTLRTTSLPTGIPNVDTRNPLTINVGGNYTQAAGGTLALGVGGLDGSQYDHVQVGGNASLNGTLAVSSLNNFRPVNGNAFEVLHTNGTREGQFAQVSDSLNNNPNLQRVNVYATNGVALLYLAVPGPTPPPGPTPTPPPGPTPTPPPGPTPSPTPNPKPPINVEVPIPLPPVDPAEPLIPPKFLLSSLDPSVEQLTSMFEIPFSGANTQRFNLTDRMTQIQRGSTGFVSPIASAPPPAPTGKEIGKKEVVPPAFVPGPTNRWGVWVNGWGDWVNVNDDNGVKGYNFTTGGASVGIDYRITDNLAIGLFGTYAHTWTSLNPGSIDVNTGLGGLYVTYWNQGFYINSAVFGGYNSYDTSRGELTNTEANGSTSGYEVSTFVDTGYDFHFGNLSFGPVFAAQYTNVHVNGFTERGSFLPLNIHSDSEESWRTDLGVRASYDWHVGNIIVIPSLWAAWEHEYKYSSLPITISSVEFPGESATVFGPHEGHDSAIINAGVGTQWTPRISTYVGYQGQLGRDNYDANGVTGTISFSF